MPSSHIPNTFVEQVADSPLCFKDSIACCSCQSVDSAKALNSVETLGVTFGISTAIVFFIALIKYRLDKEQESHEQWKFFSELPIDINTVAITILVTYYDKVSNMSYLFLFLFVSIVLSVFCSSWRRSLLKSIDDNDTIPAKCWGYIFGEYAILLVSLVMIYKVII